MEWEGNYCTEYTDPNCSALLLDHQLRVSNCIMYAQELTSFFFFFLHVICCLQIHIPMSIKTTNSTSRVK